MKCRRPYRKLFPYLLRSTDSTAAVCQLDSDLIKQRHRDEFIQNQEAIVMGSAETQNSAKDWARLALKLGMLLTEPKVRAEISHDLKDRVASVSDTIADKYDDAVDRLAAAHSALRGKTNWAPGIAGFLLGAGV